VPSGSDNFSVLARELQQGMFLVEDALRPRVKGMEYLVEQVLVRGRRITLKMYQEPGHKLPHLHVDYGKDHHSASYQLDPPERLVGELDKVYDKAVKAWITQNRDALNRIWTELQAGKNVAPIVAELGGYD
jgi:hypothetical protein